MSYEMGCGETNVGYADRNSAREAAIQSVQKPEVKRPGSGIWSVFVNPCNQGWKASYPR